MHRPIALTTLANERTMLGAGSFGTAMASLIARCGHDVLLWTPDPRIREEIDGRHTNERSLPGVVLSPRIRAVAGLAEVLDEGHKVLVFSQFTSFLARVRDLLQERDWLTEVGAGGRP